jgi:plasmid stabilization system protein ParE
MKLVWSNLAKLELIKLRTYSIDKWGLTVATHYISDVRDAAKLIASTPHRARPLKQGFHHIRVRSHYLIAKIDEQAKTVIIARLLHVAMDIERHLA